METGLYGCKECPYLTESFPQLKDHVMTVHRIIPNVKTDPESKCDQVKDGNDSQWSENDFPDLLEKLETQDDDDTTALAEEDFALKMESPDDVNFKHSDVESLKVEEEPIDVVYESVAADMIDYDDVY